MAERAPPDPRGHGRAPAGVPAGALGGRRATDCRRSRRSGWPSWPGSTPPRCARTCRTSAATAPAASATTSSTCCSRSAASSASPTTGPCVIVGIGNLGHALANYAGFGERGFVVAGAGRHRPRTRSAPASTASSVRHLDDLPAIVRDKDVHDRRHRHARRRRAGGRRPRWSRPAITSILNFAPIVIIGARGGLGAQGRSRRRAADPVSFYQERRSGAQVASVTLDTEDVASA